MIKGFAIKVLNTLGLYCVGWMIRNSYQWEGSVHAGNTTYIADSHPNSTKPRQESNMNVNGYKKTEDTQKPTNIY